MLDDLSTGRADNLKEAQAEGQVSLSIGSVRDVGLVRQLADGCSTIFHLAASVGVGAVTARPLACLENNLEGFQTLFDALGTRRQYPRVVVFSSSEVYGKSARLPLREDGDFELGPSDSPRWSYAAAKALGEFLSLAWCRERQVPVTVIRCFNTCGPRQLPTYGMVLPRFLDQALAGEALTVYGDGKQTRCFSYVGDVVEGVIRLSEHDGAAGQVFNIGSDRETSVLELAERVLALTGSSSPMRLVPYREVFGEGFQDVRRRVPDLGKIRRLIGFEAGTDLDGILRATLESRGLSPVTPLRG